jgi:hypothetical protein
VLAGHHALIRSALAAHGGREVDTQGAFAEVRKAGRRFCRYVASGPFV